MPDEPQLFHLSKQLEQRAIQFEEELKRFADSLSNTTHSAPSHPSDKSATVVKEENRSRESGYGSTDLPPAQSHSQQLVIPSIQPLLANLASLRKDLAWLLGKEPEEGNAAHNLVFPSIMRKNF
ncbi:unnamed protein product [Rodentolepis nana]|uniref:QLQ domain-containing protein n=1 Tax=Rodentolepis nana TaxID=102285 RepID=A0A0R3TPF9_RODNA|nr:unnamed protein product [Rodentolepis nana]